MLKGLYTALITPFKNGKIDEAAFESFVNWQIEQGVHGLVPCGTTGESPTLSADEHKQVVELCVKTAAGRVAVMAGTGSNSTAEAIYFTQHAQKAGSDSALVIAPYYNKPTQEGLFLHFKAIHDATDIPIIVYNVPARSVVNITDETFKRLADLPRIAGIKDATGDLARPSNLRYLVGDRLKLFSGEDMTAVGFNAQGGQGCISVASNITPQLCAEIQNKSLSGDYAGALQTHEKLVGLIQALFAETNPIPVKYAAHLLGKCTQDLRLPLSLASESVQLRIKAEMQKLGLI